MDKDDVLRKTVTAKTVVFRVTKSEIKFICTYSEENGHEKIQT